MIDSGTLLPIVLGSSMLGTRIIGLTLMLLRKMNAINTPLIYFYTTENLFAY